MAKGHAYKAIQVASDGSIKYPDVDHETWSILFKRQNEIIKNRACDEFIKGIHDLGLNENGIPDYREINARLQESTGWGVHPVNAVIPADVFFNLLAHKLFPAASFIRIREELDYLQEPDIFHEVYGHCPLLTNPEYADFIQEYGKMALKLNSKDRNLLFRLFWFTIEFGLIKTKDGLRVYGGGILSSAKETISCLEDKSVEYQKYDPLTCLRTPFRIDIVQPTYFVIDSFDDILKFDMTKVKSLIDEARTLGSFAPKFPPKDKDKPKEHKEENRYYE